MIEVLGIRFQDEGFDGDGGTAVVTFQVSLDGNAAFKKLLDGGQDGLITEIRKRFYEAEVQHREYLADKKARRGRLRLRREEDDIPF